MKKSTVLSLALLFMLLVQGCAVYTPYAPAGYAYPGYSYGYRPPYYGPRYSGWGGHHHHHGWRGGGYGWGGHPGWRRY